MSPVTSAIEQLNLSFDQLEDRLMLKIGMSDQSEVAMWLTRRVSKEFWHVLQDSHEQLLQTASEAMHADKAIDKQDVAEPIETIALSKPKLAKQPSQPSLQSAYAASAVPQAMDFSQSYAADRMPLSEAPFLVFACEVDEKEAKPSLAFKSNTGEVVKMGLTLELVVALINMMQLTIKEANWDLVMLQHHATKHLAPSSEVIH